MYDEGWYMAASGYIGSEALGVLLKQMATSENLEDWQSITLYEEHK